MKMNWKFIKYLPILVLGSSLAIPVLAGDFYKVVRADGSVEYTQTPPKKGAKAVDLPDLSVASPEKKLNQYNPEKKVAEAARKAGASSASTNSANPNYSGFAISSPADGENLWGTGGSVDVTVSIPGKLASGDKLYILVDGAPQPGVSGSRISLNNVDRGEHKLQAKIINRSGKVMASSQAVTFFMMQAQQQKKQARSG